MNFIAGWSSNDYVRPCPSIATVVLCLGALMTSPKPHVPPFNDRLRLGKGLIGRASRDLKSLKCDDDYKHDTLRGFVGGESSSGRMLTRG